MLCDYVITMFVGDSAMTKLYSPQNDSNDNILSVILIIAIKGVFKGGGGSGNFFGRGWEYFRGVEFVQGI